MQNKPMKAKGLLRSIIGKIAMLKTDIEYRGFEEYCRFIG